MPAISTAAGARTCARRGPARGHQAGDAGRGRAVLGLVAIEFAVRVEIARGRGGLRRDLARVDEHVAAALRVVQQGRSRRRPGPAELTGSTTDSAAETATAASKALPPSRRISSPASVASACAEAMATPGGAPARIAREWRMPASRPHNNRGEEKEMRFSMSRGLAPSRASLASNCTCVSGCCGSGSMHSTGQTTTHCGSSKWPTHSVQRAGRSRRCPAPARSPCSGKPVRRRRS